MSDSDDAIRFWKLVSFLFSYKDFVDIGEFENSFKVVAKKEYVIEFQSKNEFDKVEDLKELIGHSDLSYDQLKTLTFENRKKKLRVFYHLLKDIDGLR